MLCSTVWRTALRTQAGTVCSSKLQRADDVYGGPAIDWIRAAVAQKRFLPSQTFSRNTAMLDWYEAKYARVSKRKRSTDPILGLKGLGKGIWGENPDEYVRRLREGWG